MLTLPAVPTLLHRLADAPVNSIGDTIDWATPIDRSRRFFCETLTPLYYTDIYRELAPEHRHRYNQLTGILANELIVFLETQFLHSALRAVESSNPRDRALSEAVARFKQDEARHADIWHRLNRLSEPEWYSSESSRLVRVPPAVAGILRAIAQHPVAFPVVFWIQLVQEERSIEISRRCMRVPRDRIEPRYVAVYTAHLRDEVRHIQIDRHLIECFYRPRSQAVRRLTARLFRMLVGRFLLVPSASTFAVIKRLACEYPELASLAPRMRRELRALAGNDDYHRMMYSRETTPVAFELFDSFEEFHQMREVLRGYRPQAARSRAS